MRLIELIKLSQVERTSSLEDAIGKAARDLYPTFSNMEWSEKEVFEFVLYIDFSAEEINKILNRSVRYGKIWAFS